MSMSGRPSIMGFYSEFVKSPRANHLISKSLIVFDPAPDEYS